MPPRTISPDRTQADSGLDTPGAGRGGALDLRPARTPSRTPRQPAHPDYLAAAVRHVWRNRSTYGPFLATGPAYLAGHAAYAAHGGQDAALALGIAGAGALGAEVHRVYRRRAGRPLLLGQRLWQFAVAGAGALYVGLSSVFDPHSAAMAVVLGVLAAPLAATWWARGHLVKAAAPAPAETRQDEPGTAPDPGPFEQVAARIQDAWNRGLTGPDGRLPNTALTDIEPNPEHLGGGIAARVLLAADGGTIKHTPMHVAAAKDIIRQALLRALGELHPANLLIDPLPDGTASLKIVERNPLSRPACATASPAGTWTHPVARRTSGETVTTTLWLPDYGVKHRAVVGSTGSGKSALLSLLIGLAGQSRDAQGRALTWPILCDPHGGASYPQWVDRARIASEPDEIAGTLLLVCAELRRRLHWMKANRQTLVTPSPQMPLIEVLVDEVHRAIKRGEARGLPILPMLAAIANEGRKAAIRLTVGTLAFDTDVLGGTLLLDALAGELFILHSTASSTGLKVNTGLWSEAVDPRRVITKFADGTPASGCGHHLRGEEDPLSVRYLWPDEQFTASARFADPGYLALAPHDELLPGWDENGKALPIMSRVESLREWPPAPREPGESEDARDEGERRGDGDGAGQSATPIPGPRTSGQRPQPLAPAGGDSGAWETLASILGQVGAPMTLQQLCDLTGLPKSTISMALRRGADAEPPAAIRLKQGTWSLPAYADVPYLEGAAR